VGNVSLYEYFLLFCYKKYRNNINSNKKIEDFKTLENAVEDVLTNEINFYLSSDTINKKYFDDLSSEIRFYYYGYDFDTKNFTFDHYRKLEKTNKIKEKITFLNNIGFLNYEYEDEFGRKFSSLSTGEKTFFLATILIHDKIKEIQTTYGTNAVFILLDEPDTTMHPQWQKQIINEYLKLLQQFTNKFHIIATSHSPFILSDLPKENVIFLEKGKQVYPFEDEKQTFGANIHTLLSHGFFMQDGLMGEFARGKINEAIDNLHGKLQSLSQKQIKSIIDLIGEPFLQIKLEQMYKEKFGLDDEIEELQKQQEEINLKIEQLKKQKTENAES
jgi:energy-coupling factor transporter ATP-binding protein EcfA2